MTYANLSSELQTLFYFSFETKLKSFLIFGLFLFCILYLFVFFPKHRETGFFVIGFTRLILFAVSIAIVGLFPLMTGLLSPEFSLVDTVNILIYPYLVFLILFLLLIVIDVLYLGVPIMMKLAKMDLKNPKVNKAYNTLMRFSKKIR